VLVGYAQLPARIPTHFGMNGQADHFGERGSIWLLPIMASVLFGIMTKLSEFPHAFNYPYPITPGNAEREYRAAGQLLRRLKLVVVVIFSLVAGLVYRASFTAAPSLSNGLLPLTLGLSLGPLVAYLWQARRRRLTAAAEI
jgi:hypothetical protein